MACVPPLEACAHKREIAIGLFRYRLECHYAAASREDKPLSRSEDRRLLPGTSFIDPAHRCRFGRILRREGVASRSVRRDELERRLRDRLDALGPARRAELSTSSRSPTSSEPTGSASSAATRRAAPSPELLIDCEEDRMLRAVHSDGEDVLVASDLVR